MIFRTLRYLFVAYFTNYLTLFLVELRLNNPFIVESNTFSRWKESIDIISPIYSFIGSDNISGGNVFNPTQQSPLRPDIYFIKAEGVVGIKNNEFNQSHNDAILFDGAEFSSIRSNSFNECNQAIHVINSSDIYIENNQFVKPKLGISALGNIRMYITLNNNFISDNNKTSQAIKVSGKGVNISDNTFNGFSKNIQVLSSRFANIFDNLIQNIPFDNNLPNTGYGVFMQASQNFEIYDNLIKDEFIVNPPITVGPAPYPPISIPSNGGGVFNPSPLSYGAHGIIVENAQYGLNRVYRNNIENITIGIQTQNQNNNLRMKCNTVDAKYTGLLVFDELENQGVSCDLDDDNNQQLPGNVWKNTCNPNNLVSKDLILSPTALNHNFKYYTHAYGINPNGQNLRTTPDCNNLDPLAGNYIVCDGATPITPLRIMVADFCSDVNISTGWFRENPTEEIDLLAIPQEIIDQLAIKQSLVTDLATLETQLNDPDLQTELVENINQVHEEINNVNNILAELYQMNGNDAIAENLFEQENTVEAKMELVHIYMEQEDFVNASRILSEIVLLSKDDDLFLSIDKQIAYEQNRDYFAEIEEILYDGRVSNRKKSELTEIELTDLRLIQESNLPAATKAEVLLLLNGDSTEDHTIKYLSLSELNEMNNGNTTSFDYQMSISPNSATTTTTVSYTLPTDVANYALKIIDNYQNMGNIVYDTAIEGGSTSNTIDVSNYTNGIYTVVIFRDNISVASAQLIVL